MLERNEILLTLASGTGLAAQIQFCVKIQETTGWLVYLWHLVSHEDYIVGIAIKQELKLILIIRSHLSQFYLHNPAMDSINPSRIERQFKDFMSLTQHCITPNNIIPKRHWNIIENPTWELFTKKAKEKEKKLLVQKLSHLLSPPMFVVLSFSVFYLLFHSSQCG